MEAFKSTATIDENGHLILEQNLPLTTGQSVEIVIWTIPAPQTQTSHPSANTVLQNLLSNLPQQPARTIECDIPVLKEWLENTQPTPQNSEPDEAKWAYLKAKHNL